MKKVLPVLVLLAFLAGPVNGDKGQTSHPADTDHVVVRPALVKWGPSPPSLPPGAQMAILLGDPKKPGALYVTRVKMPDGYKVPPHWHPTDENVTVMQGTLLVGKGEKLDLSTLEEMPTGSFMRMPKTMRHFAMARGETILQLHGIGPFEINYVNAADDPRKQGGKK
jgi:quercetin dioxygenase-like cupin family protein